MDKRRRRILGLTKTTVDHEIQGIVSITWGSMLGGWHSRIFWPERTIVNKSTPPPLYPQIGTHLLLRVVNICTLYVFIDTQWKEGREDGGGDDDEEVVEEGYGLM